MTDGKKLRKKWRQAQFLASLMKCDGNVSVACDKAKIPRRTAFRWLKDDRCFLVEVSECFRLAHEAVILKRIFRALSSLGN
jgi:hypothetical protein